MVIPAPGSVEYKLVTSNQCSAGFRFEDSTNDDDDDDVMGCFQNLKPVGIRSDRLIGLIAPVQLQIIWAREAKIQSCNNSSLPGACHQIVVCRLSVLSSTGQPQQVDWPKWSFGLLSRLDKYAPPGAKMRIYLANRLLDLQFDGWCHDFHCQ